MQSFNQSLLTPQQSAKLEPPSTDIKQGKIITKKASNPAIVRRTSDRLTMSTNQKAQKILKKHKKSKLNAEAKVQRELKKGISKTTTKKSKIESSEEDEVAIPIKNSPSKDVSLRRSERLIPESSTPKTTPNKDQSVPIHQKDQAIAAETKTILPKKSNVEGKHITSVSSIKVKDEPAVQKSVVSASAPSVGLKRLAETFRKTKESYKIPKKVSTSIAAVTSSPKKSEPLKMVSFLLYLFYLSIFYHLLYLGS